MGSFLRTAVVLALGVAIGAIAVALKPEWAVEIERRVQPLLAQYLQAPPPPPAFASSANAVLANHELDGGFNHFLGPTISIRTPHRERHDPFASVFVTVVVDEKGNVVEASPTAGPAEFRSQAATLAKRWKFKPFARNGRPVVARLERMPVGIHPPERWQDYRQAFPEVKDWASLRISLQRTQCFGTCTDYSVEITGDGKVTYRGRSFVAVSGEHRAQIDPQVVRELVDKFRRADFLSLLNTYASDITDNPTYVTTIAFDGTKKSVIDYVGLRAGMPDALHDLENAIDIAADTDRWLLGNARTVPSLVAEHWDFKSTGADNLALAVGIAQYGNAQTMIDLIAAGAPLTSSARVGYLFRSGTALEIAAGRREGEMVRALLAAPVKWPKPAVNGALLQGARAGAIEIVEALIAYGGDAKHKDESGRTVLMSAAESGVPTVVAAVLRAEAGTAEPGARSTDVDARDDKGKTALIHNVAAYRIDGETRPGVARGAVIELLIKAGAKIEERDNDGNTALIANHSHADAAAALIKAGADVNAQNKAAETALMTCIYPDVAEVLLRAGADPERRNARGQNALEFIASRNYGDEVGAFVNAWTASHAKRETGGDRQP